MGSAVDLLRNQNQLLSSHGNAALYAALGAFVELDGYYLESEPCLVCNNPEVSMQTIKLPTIKVNHSCIIFTYKRKAYDLHNAFQMRMKRDRHRFYRPLLTFVIS